MARSGCRPPGSATACLRLAISRYSSRRSFSGAGVTIAGTISAGVDQVIIGAVIQAGAATAGADRKVGMAGRAAATAVAIAAASAMPVVIRAAATVAGVMLAAGVRAMAAATWVVVMPAAVVIWGVAVAMEAEVIIDARAAGFDRR